MKKNVINFWSKTWNKYVIGIFDPKKKKVITFDGKETSLDDIENYTAPQGNEGLGYKKYPNND